jgi:hypothetical protein
MLQSLLLFLELIEFLTSPLGFLTGLWISLYYCLLQNPNMNLALAILLPIFPLLPIYLMVKPLKF